MPDGRGNSERGLDALKFTDKVRGGRQGRGGSALAGRFPCGVWRRGAAVLAIFAALGATGLASTETSPTGEYQIKVAFLFHFSQFIDWPEGTFADASTPLTYCTIGEDPLHGALDAGLGGRTIGTRPLRVLHFKQPQYMRGCQILFIGGGGTKLLPAALASLGENSVLTVGESEHFVQEGGMIGFLLEDNKIRFEVNLDATEHARLRVSSRFLALAKRVVGGHRGT
jgi:YfiR/HmsC-like